ncbi:MAG: hypothetical protein ACOX2R_00880 [Anaerolineae bacterium]|jgi:hypothetical protein
MIIPQDRDNPAKGFPEKEMQVAYPGVYAYLKQFERELRERPGFRKYLESGGNPFYSIYNVGPYTMSAHKVVWPNIASRTDASVVSSHAMKTVIPEHVVTMVALDDPLEAHYLCAVMNSSLADFAVQSYSTRGGKSFGTPHVMRTIAVPRYEPDARIHGALSRLSRAAHSATEVGDETKVREIEAEIDQLAARLWGLTDEELQEIQESLAELG